MIEGVDYSLGRPDPACLFANGKRFAARYFSPPGGIDKDLSPDEARALTAAGIAICSNWEDFEAKPLKGFDTGVADAAMALEHALVCGMPSNRPIYFSVDFDASDAQLAGPIKFYFQGCIEVLGLDRVGGYGGLRTIKFLFDNNLIKWGWQTYAWSHGVWDPRAQVQQYKNATTVCGVSLDLDRATVDDYGQWFAFVSQEDDVTSEELAAALAPINAGLDKVSAAVTRLETTQGKRHQALMKGFTNLEGRFDNIRDRLNDLPGWRKWATGFRKLAESVDVDPPAPPA